MDDATRSENEQFENDVKRIARLLWPQDQYSGSIVIDGKERDGVFATEDMINLVEATTSRKKDKAKEDTAKLIKLAESFRRKNMSKAVKCWFITRDEPTADQRGVIPKAYQNQGLVNVLSFNQFQSKIINSLGYLSARDNYKFGSVRDPRTGSLEPAVQYIEVDLSDISSKETITLRSLTENLKQNGRYLLLGDYGAGKSMTLRHIYQSLSKSHRAGRTSKFPIYINLRDHYGQDDPAEVIERHAKSIGFNPANHLVRAWRAGFAILLIDGIDEIASFEIQGIWKKLQQNRYRAMKIVRQFIEGHPDDTGIILAGRNHFFDNDRERNRALGIIDKGFISISLNEFTDEQIRLYLKKNGGSGQIPSWIPSRPLLLGYLATRGIFSDLEEECVAEDSLAQSPAEGWDFILDRVATREAEIEAGIDGCTIRRILERLATKARSHHAGLGPLSEEDICSSFKEICGRTPTGKEFTVIQRLSGLGVAAAGESCRSFIDVDFADACRAGDFVEFIEQLHDFEESIFSNINCSIGLLGLEIAQVLMGKRKITQKNFNAAIDLASSRLYSDIFLSDLVRLAISSNITCTGSIRIRGIVCPDLDFSAASCSFRQVSFEDCLFESIYIDPAFSDQDLPKFSECYIGELHGRSSRNDISEDIFDEKCEIVSFAEDVSTTASILSLSLPTSIKVLLTILKKLYLQRGNGRRVSALSRGLDDRERRLVADILRILQAQEMAASYRSGDIWLPTRSGRKRAHAILAAPTKSTDPLLALCENI